MFVLVFLGYMWACVLSLFQIIFVVNSPKYRSLYGDDPIHANRNGIPIKNSIKKVKFYPSPDFAHDAAQKQTNLIHLDHASNQTERARNEYNELKSNFYLKSRQLTASTRTTSFF